MEIFSVPGGCTTYQYGTNYCITVTNLESGLNFYPQCLPLSIGTLNLLWNIVQFPHNT